MSKQLQQPPVKIEPPTVIKNESPEPEIVEITIDDILDSSDEEIIEDMVTGQGVVEVQDSNEHINALGNLKNDKQLMLNSSNNLDGISVTNRKPECETTSCDKDKEKIKIIKAPVIPVKSHEFTTLSKGKHVCNHCQYTCNYLSQLKRHITKVHREITEMYQCTYCPVKTKYIWGLRRHIKKKHTDTQEILKCHLCDKKFKVKGFLSRHIMLVHVTHEQMNDKLTLCPLCGNGFKTTFSMKKHVRYVHNKERKKRLKCEHCEYTTAAWECLRLHVNKHHTRHDLPNPSPSGVSSTLERFCCDKCDYATYRTQNFTRHKVIHLKPEEIQYFRCYHCPYKCKQKTNIKYHVWTHRQGMTNPYKRQKSSTINLKKK